MPRDGQRKAAIQLVEDVTISMLEAQARATIFHNASIERLEKRRTAKDLKAHAAETLRTNGLRFIRDRAHADFLALEHNRKVFLARLKETK